MSRFNCTDCCFNNTKACRFGEYKSNDYSEYCLDIFVEQNVAYEKALFDIVKWLYEDKKWLEELDATHTFSVSAEDKELMLVREFLKRGKEYERKKNT